MPHHWIRHDVLHQRIHVVGLFSHRRGSQGEGKPTMFYLGEMGTWKQLTITPQKFSVTLFTSDNHQSWLHPQVRIRNEVATLNRNPKILVVTLDNYFTFGSHVQDCVERATRALNVMKALAVKVKVLLGYIPNYNILRSILQLWKSILKLWKSILKLWKSILQLWKSILQLWKSILHFWKLILYFWKLILHLWKSNLHLWKSNLHLWKSNLHLWKSNLHLWKSILQIWKSFLQ